MFDDPLKNTVSYLTEVCTAAGEIDSYALGEEAALNRTNKIVQRNAIIQLALIQNLIEASHKSIDHLSVLFSINRAMVSCAHDICPERDFWQLTTSFNKTLIKAGFNSASESILSAQKKINYQIENLNKSTAPDVRHTQEISIQRDHFKAVQGRLISADETRKEIEMSVMDRRVPEIVSGRSEIMDYFTALNREDLSSASEQAAKAYIDVARFYLVEGNFLEQSLTPVCSGNDKVLSRRYVAAVRENSLAILMRADLYLDIRDMAQKFHLPAPQHLPI